MAINRVPADSANKLIYEKTRLEELSFVMQEQPMTFLRQEDRKSIERYHKEHEDPGSFLKACLENDLISAMRLADTYHAVTIFPIMAFIYNFLPMNCYGSKEKVIAWLQQRGK
jgi:hypothetical protein